VQGDEPSVLTFEDVAVQVTSNFEAPSPAAAPATASQPADPVAQVTRPRGEWLNRMTRFFSRGPSG
jgi:hypothetical protein